VRVQGGRVVAHVGVLDVPLVLDSRATHVGGIHAVATLPEHRGKGHMRGLMEEALRWCDARYETLILSGDPPLYERYGFRFWQESRFVGAAPALRAAGRPMRRLEREDPRDLAVLHRLLDTRMPVSTRMGVGPERPIFLFDESLRILHYAEDLDVVVSFVIEGGTLRLYDVVGTRVPPLRSVVERLPAPVERVECYFSPDRLQADLAPEPHVLDGDDTMMVRGPFLPEGTPAMWPRTGRC
jgi:hypothetical protein